jgi:hypothetical protein
MAWLEQTYMNGQHKYWTDTDTGEVVYTQPSGQIVNQAPQATWTESKYMDGQHSAFTNDKTGEVVYNKDATLTDAQREQQFMDLWNDPNASSWDKAQAVKNTYGVESLAQLYKQGHFSDISDAVGRDIASGQAQAESEGFSVGGNQLGNWPTIIGTAGFAALAGAGAGAAGAEGAAAGGSAAGGGAAAPAGVTYGTAAGDAATIYGTGTATGGGSAGLAGGTAGGTAAADSLLAEPYGGFDSAAIEGADFTAAGAEGAGLSLGGAGAGALGGTSALSAAGGGSAAAGGGGGSGGGGSATGGGGTGGGSWLTSDDEWLRMLMRGAPGLLGALGSASQAEDFEDLANQYSHMGAPYRSKLQELYGNPQAFLNSPEVRVPIQQGTDMLARSLSVKGNPAGSGNALQELQNYTSNQLFSRLGQEKDRLGGFGGLTQYNQAAPQMAQSALAAQGNIYGDLGGAAADIFNPPKRYTLQDLMRSMG